MSVVQLSCEHRFPVGDGHLLSGSFFTASKLRTPDSSRDTCATNNSLTNREFALFLWLSALSFARWAQAPPSMDGDRKSRHPQVREAGSRTSRPAKLKTSTRMSPSGEPAEEPASTSTGHFEIAQHLHRTPFLNKTFASLRGSRILFCQTGLGLAAFSIWVEPPEPSPREGYLGNRGHRLRQLSPADPAPRPWACVPPAVAQQSKSWSPSLSLILRSSGSTLSSAMK